MRIEIIRDKQGFKRIKIKSRLGSFTILTHGNFYVLDKLDYGRYSIDGWALTSMKRHVYKNGTNRQVAILKRRQKHGSF